MDEEEDKETNEPMRKAKKKLREIEKLKQKVTKSPEEYKKIKEEEIWLSIVTPPDIMPTEEEQRERKQKQRDKARIKELEHKLQEERKQHKQEMNRLHKDYKRQLFLHQESELNTFMEEDFCTLSSQLGEPKKAWHKLMRKYHTDKCEGKVGELLSKLLNELKEKYVV